MANPEKNKNCNSELVLKIYKKSLIKNKINNEKELYVDENWKISAKVSDKIKCDKNLKLTKILSKSFPNKNISIKDNKDGTQTIYIL